MGDFAASPLVFSEVVVSAENSESFSSGVRRVYSSRRVYSLVGMLNFYNGVQQSLRVCSKKVIS